MQILKYATQLMSSVAGNWACSKNTDVRRMAKNLATEKYKQKHYLFIYLL